MNGMKNGPLGEGERTGDKENMEEAGVGAIATR